MTGATYDTGALLAGQRNDRLMWSLHSGFLDEEVLPVVPAPVLAQAWRGGGRQANLSWMLALCRVEHLTEAAARAVGVLASRSGHSDIVDLSVVESAARRSDVIVTSDPGDVSAILQAAGLTLAVAVV